MNKRATIQKVVDFVEEAGKDGVDLLVFPETFVPGYPVSCQVLPNSLNRTSIINLTSTLSNVIHH